MVAMSPMSDDSSGKATALIPTLSESALPIPAAIRGAGRKAARRFIEFFAANIRNRNTREAYYRALTDFFAWCDDRGFALIDIKPVVVAAYVEYLGEIYAKPTVKQH